MSGEVFRIGTRGSKLALWQARHVADALKSAYPELEAEICVIRTTGDKAFDAPLSKIGGKGLFTKELEAALAEGRVDCCVHSMKDVPTDLPEGLAIAATLARADARDCLVASAGATLATLAAGARVGTGSLRRRAQLRSIRPDLEYCELRGNIDTRIGKVECGELDAAVLAVAGIERMGWTGHIAEYIDPLVLVPAPAQGAIGIEVRDDDERTRAYCDALNDCETFACVSAERHVMRMLEGGCQVPIGAWARFEEGEIVLDALVCSAHASHVLRAHASGDDAAQRAVDELLSQGAKKILAKMRRE